MKTKIKKKRSSPKIEQCLSPESSADQKKSPEIIQCSDADHSQIIGGLSPSVFGTPDIKYRTIACSIALKLRTISQQLHLCTTGSSCQIRDATELHLTEFVFQKNSLLRPAATEIETDATQSSKVVLPPTKQTKCERRSLLQMMLDCWLAGRTHKQCSRARTSPQSADVSDQQYFLRLCMII